MKAEKRHNQKQKKVQRDSPTSFNQGWQAKSGYDHRAIEQKWQKVWLEMRLDEVDIRGAKKPFYNLMMFPYPSAEGLHVGNMYAFTGSDIYGRFKRMQGYDVFEPIGLDGFGIHSENYAFKIGRHPANQAKISQERFYRQLQQIGAMYDWSRTLETYDPNYYHWTQWLFVQMFKHGLAYRGKAEVNWCPSCKTVLADEQVISGGCERCGNIVENRLLKQWFFRITAYAGKLLENTFKLNWSEKVLVAQRNWIGKKEGINITYPVIDERGQPLTFDHQPLTLTCFTTRPDTNFGATFVVIAPENDLVSRITPHVSPDKKKEIATYLQAAKKKSKEERIAEGRKKTGVFTGFYCLNQLNNYKMPLYVSDFVIMEVGTGAVVGVPGHDKRDFEFAQATKLPVVRVVVGPDGDTSPIIRIEQIQEEEGKMINSGFLDGLEIHEAIPKMMDYLEAKGWGKRVTTYHLRDWLISRQRYWGPPIPMIYCEKCTKEGKSWFTTEEAKEYLGTSIKYQGKEESKNLNTKYQPLNTSSMVGWYPVPEDQLPVQLPDIKDYKPGDDGVAPLAKHREFYETTCPGCGGKAVRETDVSDTFLDSSWYFLRYPSVGVVNGAKISPPEVANRNLDPSSNNSSRSASYSSGLKSEAGLNFVGSPAGFPAHKSLPWDPEITKKWLPVSMYTGGAEHSVLHLMYSRFITMALHDWGYLDFDEPFPHFYAHGLVIKDGAKMSKSKGNVVNPDEYIALHGADALRLYLMFMGPFDQGGDFRDTAMEGMYRWVNRVWRLAVKSEKLKVKSENQEIRRTLHRLIKKVTEDVEKRRYNTAIAAMMEFTNLVGDRGGVLDQNSLKAFILILAPFAPHLAEELWQRVNGAEVANRNLDPSSNNSSRSASYSSGLKSEAGLNFVGSPAGFPAPGSHWSVHQEPWPSFDPKMVEEDTVAMIVQVNGKLRDTLQVLNSKCKVQSEVEKLARKSEKVQKYLARQTVKKIIFVPGKLINFVV